jgi:polar amino acid transport system permease protein
VGELVPPLLAGLSVTLKLTLGGALVQLFWFYFVLPLFGLSLSATVVAILVLGLNAGAYGAEVVRGAILAVSKGQWEAAISLNLSRRSTMWRIILPQAVPAMLPPAGNLLIELLKNTALVSLITITDLTFSAQILRAETLKTTEIFSLVLLMYFAAAMVIAAMMRLLERWLSRTQGRAVT